jgi:hypothetical protein
MKNTLLRQGVAKLSGSVHSVSVSCVGKSIVEYDVDKVVIISVHLLR